MLNAHLTNLLGALTTTAADRVREAQARRLGLGGSAPAALLTIYTWPGRSIEELRGVLGISQPATVRVVDRLAAAGLVDRQPGRNGRVLALVVSDRGAKLARELLELRRSTLEGLLVKLPADQRKTLEGMLATMLRQVAGDREQARHLCRVCEHEVCRGDACPIGSSVGID